MKSLLTFLRAAVMLLTLGLLVKIWFAYGYTVPEMKAIGAQALSLGRQAWADYWQEPNNGPRLAGEPAPFVPPTGVAPIPVTPGARPQGTGPVQLAGAAPELLPQSTAIANAPSQPTRLPADPLSTQRPKQDDRLQATLERLAAMGVADQELGPWGSEGRVCRFSCSVPWGRTANFTQHFEAVAATPLEAVEKVAAEIDAWRKSR